MRFARKLDVLSEFKLLIRERLYPGLGVRKEWESIDITYCSEPVARLTPIRRIPPTEEELAAYWADVGQLAAEIGEKWPEGVSAANGVRDIRREL